MTEALQALAALAGSSRAGASRSRRRSRSPPGSAAAAPTRPPRCCLANELLPRAARARAARRARGDRSARTCRSSSTTGRSSAPATAPLSRPSTCRTTTGSCSSLPSSAVKTSTGDVYRAFDHGTAPRASRSGGRHCSTALAGVQRPARPRRAPAERSRLVARLRAASRGRRVPRRRQRRRPLRLRPLRRPAGGRSSGRRRCVPRGRPGSSRRFGTPTRRARCVYRMGMSGLVVEHRESQFSRRLRRRRVQIAVGIAAVEAVLVVAGILPWWLVVVGRRRIGRRCTSGSAGITPRPAFARRRGSPPFRSSSSCSCPSASSSSASWRSSSSRFWRPLRWPCSCSTAADRPDRPAAGYTRRPDSLGRGQVVRQRALVP